MILSLEGLIVETKKQRNGWKMNARWLYYEHM